MLIVAAIIFICCWLPHVICFLCLELSAGKVCQCPSSISEYGLLLGEFFLIENLFIEFFLFTSVTFFFFYSFQNICEGSLSLKSHSHFYQLFRSISINFHNYFRNLVSPYIYSVHELKFIFCFIYFFRIFPFSNNTNILLDFES